MEYRTLPNGVRIPAIGFGTWRVADGREAVDSVRWALEAGFRLIDDAEAYENEESVGEGIISSGVPRGDIFITTKLRNPIRGYKETIAACEESMRKLKVSYLDLFLIHWPRPRKYHDDYIRQNAESWRAMEDMLRAGKIRAIGVSNFMPHHLDELLRTAEIVPMVNQIMRFPGFVHPESVSYAKAHGIQLEAYTPLGRPSLIGNAAIGAIAEKHGVSDAQVMLRYQIESGVIPLSKSVHRERIISNLDVFSFSLTPEEVRALDALPLEKIPQTPSSIDEIMF